MAERRDYKRIEEFGCVVTTIEIVTDRMNLRELSETLERCREHSAAEVVGQFCVADDIEEAHKILRRKALTDYIGSDL